MEGSRLYAVIDIGSTAIRMVIAESLDEENWRVIDRAERPVPLGRDVFVHGYISRDTMNQTLRILRGFREVLEGWQIQAQDARVIATSAIREAGNRDTFIDRVSLRTEFQVETVEGIEESRLTFLAVQNALKDMKSEFSRSNSLIIEVGGGSTEVMLLRRGKMAAAHSLNLGIVRIAQQIRPAVQAGRYMERFLSESIRTKMELFDTEMHISKIRHFIAVGGDARIAVRSVKGPVSGEYARMGKEDFLAFLESIQRKSIDDLVVELQIPYSNAEWLIPSLFVYREFLMATSAEEIIVPMVSIRDGLLVSIMQGPDPVVRQQFASQILASATNLGRKYHFDEEHSLLIARLACSLFDQIQDEHCIHSHGRLLLQMAGILHDVGTFINSSGHHKHGQYIVRNSEIFGLNRQDLRIVSNVIRYHRKAFPSPAHQDYISLTRENRITVLKLSAILRVADALDRGHSQRIQSIRVERAEDVLNLHTDGVGDFTLERAGLENKGKLFEEVFGLQVRLL
ncbi:MAG: Ppx/GppA family phosphatase [Spirochaetales bacterium]|nr:Ppx/GppA family phosphatase [Spirochaetales bacterium]MCF7938273.1 Ppx/GppA family phosphatase [Spirochaetales bacterium]